MARDASLRGRASDTADENPWAAPGTLEIVRQLVNTLDLEGGIDAIETPRGLSDWLLAQGLVSGRVRVNKTQVQRAVELRERLRDCLQANHERAPVPAAARKVLNDVAERASLVLTLDADGRWRPEVRGRGVDAALGRIVAIVAEAMAAGDWSRLKVCQNDACRWAFYDRSRARTGRWCSMSLCGNRMKQQAWRRRIRARTGEAG